MKRFLRITIKPAIHLKCVDGIITASSCDGYRWSIGKSMNVVHDWLDAKHIRYSIMGWKPRRDDKLK